MDGINKHLENTYIFIAVALSLALTFGGLLIYITRHNYMIALFWCVAYIFGGLFGMSPRSRIGQVLALGLLFGTVCPVLGWVAVNLR